MKGQRRASESKSDGIASAGCWSPFNKKLQIFCDVPGCSHFERVVFAESLENYILIWTDACLVVSWAGSLIVEVNIVGLNDWHRGGTEDLQPQRI